MTGGIVPWCALLWTAGMVSAQAATIEQLIEPMLVKDIEISPGGQYLALRVFQDDKHVLQVLERATMQQVAGFGFPGRIEVGTVYWANDERVVGEVWEAPLGGRQPRNYGELFAVNADGSRAEILFGFRSGDRQVGTHLARKDSDRAWARIIDVLPDDDRRILISATTWSRQRENPPRVQLLDVYSGVDRPVSVPPIWGQGRFHTDREGEIRLITGVDDDGTRRVQARSGESEWLELPTSAHGDGFSPVAVADDGESAYVLDDRRGRRGLYRMSLDGEGYELLYEHESVDVTAAVTSTDGRSVYALRVDDGYPSYLILKEAHEEAAVFRDLLKTFAGNLLSIESRSRDGRYWIVKTGTDVDEGSFYLLDREARELVQLFDSREGVAADELSPMEPVDFVSFDGQRIQGYFTRARTRGEGPAPMVVLVHGGPASRDYWGYSPVVQVLATRGFSVLQINYRGSSGYGRGFEAMGDRQWGANVQQDLIAGTRWAIDEGLAPEGRVCIMGRSFGAYSAVQSATLEPELFACVIANAGVYDLPLMYHRGDVSDFYWGEPYLEQKIGRDEAELARYSPVNNVHKLAAPVFIAHGRQDDRAPFEHARRLKRALEKHDKPFEWFIKGREGHGFYSTANQLEYLQAAVAFLRQHLR